VTGIARLRAVIPAAAGRLLRTRWLVRAPIWLYRWRLGAVFGSRLLMLEHTGRKTGARRYAVLEIIDHPAPGDYVVSSGFGARAQWFRNVRADPRVRLYLGSRRPAPATAHLLAPGEAAAALAAYAARHPRAWATLKPVLETTLGTTISDRQTSLPLVRLALGNSVLGHARLRGLACQGRLGSSRNCAFAAAYVGAGHPGARADPGRPDGTRRIDGPGLPAAAGGPDAGADRGGSADPRVRQRTAGQGRESLAVLAAAEAKVPVTVPARAHRASGLSMAAVARVTSRCERLAGRADISVLDRDLAG
jgi:deazaflavin-dependent oxidoreductase (nitroreductase family)